MAYLNISILNDDHTVQNAVFTIGGQGAENLKTVLAKCGNLMPGEMLQNLASSIQHLGDVKYLSNADMIKAMEDESADKDQPQLGLDNTDRNVMSKIPIPEALPPYEPYTTGPLDIGQAPEQPNVEPVAIINPQPETASAVSQEPTPQA